MIAGWRGEDPSKGPSLEAFIATMKRKMTKEEEVLLMRTLPGLVKIAAEQRHIPESVFDELGYPLDKVSHHANSRSVAKAKHSFASVFLTST
jgi:hypothetical protein